MIDMDKIEKIRQEIERRKGICMAQIKANPGQTFPFVMEMTGYDKLLSFLDTLSEEPDKSLEEAAEEYTQKMLESWKFDSTGCRPPRESFKAGAEWQKEHMEQLADEVDFAKHLEHLRESQRQANLDKFIEFRWGEGNISKVNFIDSIKSAFEIGQEQMKQQLLKEAVEGTMTNVGGSFGYDVLSAKYDDDHTITMCVPHEEGRKYGDKVKLIIVKEEGE